ncbi:hypothetical protein [Morganella psychrotolerans]|nr:hypothetical protein [Morganella psychrotolerans]
MGYIFGAFEIPQIDVYQASELAAKKMLRMGIYRG